MPDYVEGVIEAVFCPDLSCCIRRGVSVEQQTCTTAATHGHVVCLKQAVRLGFRLNANAASAAARGGHLQCLKSLTRNQARITLTAFIAAALHDRLDCLRYLCESKDTYKDSIDVCVLATQGGSVRCLHYLVQNGYRMDKLCHIAAASGGYVPCMQYLHENRCPWDEQTMYVAARSGSLACLLYAYDNGCPWWSLDIGFELLSTSSADCALFLNKYCPLVLKLGQSAVMSDQCIAFLQSLQVRRATSIWCMSKYALPVPFLRDTAPFPRKGAVSCPSLQKYCCSVDYSAAWQPTVQS